MNKELTYHFSGKQVTYYLGGSLSSLEDSIAKEKCILITDDTIHRFHTKAFAGYKTIVIPSGEHYKNQDTVNDIIAQLISLEANRKSLIIGVGGGVVTDITGYVASVFMRGIKFGFIPTTILSQVDASIGGKNGIDVGMYKNLVGIIRQPEFIIFDFQFLSSLPEEQWVNGFAEIIKHACISDRSLFELLEQHQLNDFRKDSGLLATLIEKNITIKSNIVSRDEFEEGERKLLNFGHTLGHAIENVFNLPHGFAVSIGMVAAAAISVEKGLLPASQKQRLVSLLQQYKLPITIDINHHREPVLMNLKMDKKRSSTEIDFILLKQIGEALIRPISFAEINTIMDASFAQPQLRKLDV